MFAISDWRALGAYLALSELDIKVPEEVRIIGFDNISAAIQTILNITCIQQDTRSIAKGVFELLNRQITGKQIHTKGSLFQPVS
ncbi:MAG: substrate-binding domain-containing protein [Erysipelotrichaceae bacterium]|nr:substrate-binding domain-containing protein [Erysipelotrichaceae bacterium]